MRLSSDVASRKRGGLDSVLGFVGICLLLQESRGREGEGAGPLLRSLETRQRPAFVFVLTTCGVFFSLLGNAEVLGFLPSV